MNETSLWQKIVLAWKTLVPNWRVLVQKSLPCLLAVALTAAVCLSMTGDGSLFGWSASAQQPGSDWASEKQALETSQKELEATLSKTQALLEQMTTANQNMQALLQQAVREEEVVDGKIDELQGAFDKAEQEALQKWITPIKYKKCTSYFGYRRHPIAGQSTFHSGLDLAAAQGTPVVASRGGTVVRATYDDVSGYYVAIDHGDGYISYYMHMSRYTVTTGQVVIAGQVIGYCGSSGASTGPHLHFGIYYEGTAVDPAEYIDM